MLLSFVDHYQQGAGFKLISEALETELSGFRTVYLCKKYMYELCSVSHCY